MSCLTCGKTHCCNFGGEQILGSLPPRVDLAGATPITYPGMVCRTLLPLRIHSDRSVQGVRESIISAEHRAALLASQRR